MNRGQRQVIAEKVSSTIRILELLEFYHYEVRAPRNKREKGNKSPRVVCVNIGKSKPLLIYNSTRGHTWANQPDGKPVPGVHSIEELYAHMAELKRRSNGVELNVGPDRWLACAPRGRSTSR